MIFLRKFVGLKGIGYERIGTINFRLIKSHWHWREIRNEIQNNYCVNLLFVFRNKIKDNKKRRC